MTSWCSLMLCVRCWETFLIVLVGYSAWVCPFELGFIDRLEGGLLIADIIIDAFFSIDFILTFFVAYCDDKTQILIVSPKKIAMRYAKLHSFPDKLTE